MIRDVTVRRHGDGYTIHFGVTGAYVECWALNGERFITTYFFEGGGRSLHWTNDAIRVLSIARHWQWCGEMPTNVVVLPDRNTRSL